MENLNHKWVPVTGASSGIGDATAERLAIAGLGNILAVQRTAFLRDGSPSLAQRRVDPKKLKSAMIARRKAIEDAVDADFGILRWVQRYLPEFEKRWRRYARPVGGSWRMDET